MISDVDVILERACKKALPRILEHIEKNKAKKLAKEKYLKRMRNRMGGKG